MHAASKTATRALPESWHALVNAMRAGERFALFFFYGHAPADPTRVDASCLSQWYAAAPFEVDGIRYATAEHWMMAGKARLFGDAETLAEILACSTPGEAKALGRRVRGFDEAAWKAHRSGLVVEGNVAKFTQHAELRAFLLATGDAVLVEAAPRDRIWGIGMGASNPDAADPAKWRGQNLLGFALVRTRAQLLLQSVRGAS